MTLSQHYMYIKFKYQGMVFERKLKVHEQIEILKILMDKGSEGVNAFELSDELTKHLSGCVYQLRGFGLSIATKREKRGAGWRGRYILTTDVEIL